MTHPVPADPKIYHIVHVDRLASIISNGCLWSDAEIQRCNAGGTTIGMEKIKTRRMSTPLSNYRDLHVGDCVPFYFCPRSVMLYMFDKNNHQEITYKGGQQPIVHLVASLYRVVQWAATYGKRWVFTTSNAGSSYFDDYADLNQLNQINWNAVNATFWPEVREEKQAEFLIEQQFPWELVENIGVYSQLYNQQVSSILTSATHRPITTIQRNWYY